MLDHMQEKAARGARRAALGAAGLILAATGIAFLTAALFIVLSALRDPAFAALVVGLIHAGAGALLLALSRAKSHKPAAPPRPERQPEEPITVLASAFMKGFDSGKAVRAR